MNIHIKYSIRTLSLAGLAISLTACESDITVVDNLANQGASLTAYRVDEAPIDSVCACASSDELMPLNCGTPSVPHFENDFVHTVFDGSVVAFNLCEENSIEDCHVLYWDGVFAELPIASGMLVGLSASGARVLTTGGSEEPGMQLIGLNGTTTIEMEAVVGQGLLSASGDRVVGAVMEGNTTYLARADVRTGEVQRLGELNGLARVYSTPDASAIVGFASGVLGETGEKPFRWTGEELLFDVPGAPASAPVWPEAISADGSVLAGRSLSEDMHFRWSEANGYVEVAPASWVSETYLSSDGDVVLGSLDPEGSIDSVAFRWTEATGAVELTPGVPSYATDMSDDGSVIVATSWESAQQSDVPPEQTYIWDEQDGTRTLEEILQARGVDVTGWEFGLARSLSGDGKVLLGHARCGDQPALYRIVLSQ